MKQALVIDDDSLARLAIQNTLLEGGYEVLTAGNGQEGLELLSQNQVQLVICDWEMPVMNGIEFCKAVRNSNLNRYIYVIMLTSNNQSEDIISGLHAGADDYVTKPFHPGELLMRANVGQRIIGLESREMTIFALAKLAESRDPETGAHLERVRSYCRVLALQLQKQPRYQNLVDDNFINLVYETSPLHDIGKVAIPDSVLLKPGRLTDSEYELMKTHTLKGAETLAAAVKQFPNARFLQMAHDIALHHHERFDGDGYPYGLAGEAIPLESRIVAVADVYDALTSKRVYKESYSHEMAAEIIQNESGSHFDPEIVAAFLEVEDEFIQIRKNNADCENEEEEARKRCITAEKRLLLSHGALA